MKKLLALVVCLAFLATGCAISFYKKNPKDKAKIEELESEVDRLNRLREQESQEFENLKKRLEARLRGEIAKDQVGVTIEERGVVITLADEINFDSGKAVIKKEAYPILDKVIAVIKTDVPNKNIGIEGHTDNEPIKYSGWKSNRELSTARANSVLEYLVSQDIEPDRLTAIGYGEYRPITSNDTAEGRAKNRRVEIVILPEYPRSKVFEPAREGWVK